jgi:hypothetical protein
VWHTDLIKDPDTLRRVDATLADDAAHFGPLSVSKTAQAIDAIVDRHDPAAVRRARAGGRGRDVVISPADDHSGTANLWGSLFANDAAVLERRLSQMAHDVCDQDPRTIAQRRADALGALAAGADRLACGCGSTQCPTGENPDPRAAAVVIQVVRNSPRGRCVSPALLRTPRFRLILSQVVLDWKPIRPHRGERDPYQRRPWEVVDYLRRPTVRCRAALRSAGISG